MKKQRKRIPLKALQLNKGQVDWLPKNPRKWSDEDRELMIKSLDEDPDFMEDRPPLVIENPNTPGTYVVFGGNLRIDAERIRKKAEGIDCVLYIVEDITDDRMTVIRRAMKDNGTFGHWDMDIMASEWGGLPLADWGVPSWSMESEADTPKEVEEDDFDEEAEYPQRAQAGDIFMLGEHRLMCGDSTKPEDVDRLMAGDVADLVFTDPPYGVSYVGVNNPNGKEWTMIANDDLRGDKLFQFLLYAFQNLSKHLKEDGAFYVWFASSNHVQFETALQAAGLRVKQEIIWDKGMVLGHSDYHWAYEPCLYGTHKDHNCTWYGDRSQKTFLAMNRTEIRDLKKEDLTQLLLLLHEGRAVWRISRDNVAEYIHPTQKPIALAGRALTNSSCAGQIVLDLFGGSGSTLMAAEQLGRCARVMEFDPKYVDKIIARWEKYTGLKAEKLN